MHDINCHLRNAVALTEERKAVLVYDPLRPEACLLQHSLGGTQSRFFIFNRNQHMVGQCFAESLIRAFIRTREVSPGVGETLDGSGNNAETHQGQQQYEPPCVEDVGQSDRVEQVQHLWRIGLCISSASVAGRCRITVPAAEIMTTRMSRMTPVLMAARVCQIFRGTDAAMSIPFYRWKSTFRANAIQSRKLLKSMLIVEVAVITTGQIVSHITQHSAGISRRPQDCSVFGSSVFIKPTTVRRADRPTDTWTPRIVIPCVILTISLWDKPPM
jgi:hypothetical protein